MSVAKCIEIIAESDKSWDDAAKVAVSKVGETVSNISSLYAKDHSLVVKDGKITYRLLCKITFILK